MKSSLETEIPKLEDTVRDELEGEITLKECQDILRTFKPEKSPGDDRFTWEFYNCFFDWLGRDLVDSFNSAYNTGESPSVEVLFRLFRRRILILNYSITGAQ